MDNQIDKEEVFEFLDNLRESGVTNMFGAGSYIKEAFDVTKQVANNLLLNGCKRSVNAIRLISPYQ